MNTMTFRGENIPVIATRMPKKMVRALDDIAEEYETTRAEATRAALSDGIADSLGKRWEDEYENEPTSCPKCQEEVTDDMEFCPACGNQLPDESEEEADSKEED